MKVYTRTGDAGETSLYSGKRISKDSVHIEAIGDVDECNSMLGASVAHLPDGDKFKNCREQLETIQHALFDVGAALATPLSQASDRKIDQTRFGDHATTVLEEWIDEMETELPSLKAFILPGGTPGGSHLHVARGICRRAERSVLKVHLTGELELAPLIYLNRLSDYLFVAARYINFLNGRAETEWEHHKIDR